MLLLTKKIYQYTDDKKYDKKFVNKTHLMKKNEIVCNYQRISRFVNKYYRLCYHR